MAYKTPSDVALALLSNKIKRQSVAQQLCRLRKKEKELAQIKKPTLVDIYDLDGIRNEILNLETGRQLASIKKNNPNSPIMLI